MEERKVSGSDGEYLHRVNEMRRWIAVLFALLLIVPAAAEEDIESREYANELQDRFGVTILMGDECLGTETDAASFTLGSGYPATTPLRQLLGQKGTEDQLCVIEQALSRYPDGFFGIFKNDRTPKGLRILLADEIINKDPDNPAVAYHLAGEEYNNIFLAYGTFREFVVHHEIWHGLEAEISAVYPRAFENWDDFNPEGFSYSQDEKKKRRIRS